MEDDKEEVNLPTSAEQIPPLPTGGGAIVFGAILVAIVIFIYAYARN